MTLNSLPPSYLASAITIHTQQEPFSALPQIHEVQSVTDVDIGASIRTVCKKYFGIEMDYIGHLDYDSAVWQSIRRKRPLMLEFPNSGIVSNIEHIVQNLIKRHGGEKNGII